jgi:Flp pilus assembly protein TadD
MKFRDNVIIATVMSALFLGLVGCAQKEGPAEKAGKSVDKAMDKAGQQIEQAGKSVQDAAKGENK